MYNLRPYQEKAVSDLIAGIKGGCKKIILQAPTGSGKTIIGSRIIHGASRKSKKVLFLAHRSELIGQCSEKLSAMDVFHGIIQGSRPPQASARVWVASVQTLVNRTIPAPDIIIIDEAHHARAGSYEKIIARYPGALLLGLTATPGRIDGKGLGTLFEKIIPVISYQDLIAQGFLVPFHIWEPTTIDFTGVKVTGGDFNQKEKQARLKKSKIYGDIVDHWMDKARNRSTILFASSIEDSKGFVEKFSALGVVAAHVDGTTESQKRQEIFNGFRCGKIQMLCNVGVATEGTDLPIASALILANPTKSLTLHHQMVGRGLRIHPESGKEDCIILDHVGNHQRLGWIDDTIEWTLDCKKKVRNVTAENTTTPIRTCPVCYFAMRGGSPKCERCGHEFVVKKRELVKVDTKLREAQRKAMPATNKGAIRIDIPRTDPLGYYAESLRIAKELGYRPGWASARFNAVFGKYPRFDPDDVKIRIMELEYERSSNE